MTSNTRRQFLKTAGATAALSAFPGLLQQALAIPANNATRSIKDVEHVVLLMQENRSFDSYYGMMAGVRGFGDRFPIPLPGGRTVLQQSNGKRVVLPYYIDQRRGNAQRRYGTPHAWSDAQNAWADGRMAEWPRYKNDHSMGYHTANELAYHYALANAFTLCDAYHCSLIGGTDPNRLFYLTGTNGPAAGVAAVNNEWDPIGPSNQGFTWTTYAERLEQAGVTWRVYQNRPENWDCNMLQGFRQFRRANEAVGNTPSGPPYIAWTPDHDKTQPLYKGIGNTMPKSGLNTPSSTRLEEFRADVLANRLPQVCWMVAPADYCEHPGPSSPVQGMWYVQEILSALVANPEVWAKAVFIINYDENDGYFDHAPPPALHSLNPDRSPAGASTLADKDLEAERFTHANPPGSRYQPKPDGRLYGPGTRVPCLVVSPWSRGGWVNSEVFDHTSVLRFLEQRFGVQEPNISPFRRAMCGDLTSAFNFVDPNTEALPPLPELSRSEADAIRQAQERMQQVAVPPEATQRAPQQARGMRPSRALPYELHAQAAADPAAYAIQLRFRNSGAVGVVFHVYDRLHLDRVPRRYSVEAGKELAGTWDLKADNGKYDLWVLGPNGFHRHFTGDTAAIAADGKPRPEVTAAYDRQARTLVLTLANPGAAPCTFLAKANAYETWSARQVVPAGGTATISRPLKLLSNWYDHSVTVEGDGQFARRFAGRLEDGRHSVSDPAMGQAGTA